MQAALRIGPLPERALDAAAVFHRDYLSAARSALADADALAVVFAAADYDHASWRKAVIADLAREAAPRRVNAVAGSDEAAIAATLAWLARSEGVTGQLFEVEATNAGNCPQ